MFASTYYDSKKTKNEKRTAAQYEADLKQFDNVKAETAGMFANINQDIKDCWDIAKHFKLGGQGGADNQRNEEEDEEAIKQREEEKRAERAKRKRRNAARKAAIFQGTRQSFPF